MGVSRERSFVLCRLIFCGEEKLASMEGEVDQTLKRVNGELRMIGSRLDRIDKKLPDFDLKIKDLKEEEDKVARYWSDLESDHQTTFLRTQRRLDNTMERRVEAEERRRGKPLWNHHHTRFLFLSQFSLELGYSKTLMGRTTLLSEWRCPSGCNRSTEALL